MPVFLCRWPTGDFSVVKAPNKDQAIEFLDEVGNAEGCPVKAMRDFMVHFQLTDEGKFALETLPFGEETENQIMGLGYPILDKAFLDAPTTTSGYTEEGEKSIRVAVRKERERISARKAREPKTLLGRRIKGMTDAPSKMIDRVVESEAAETLKKFKGKGKTN
jgi:hypothetical protein